MTINLGKALNFPFSDKDWVSKIVLAIVMLFIPFLGWAILAGYFVRTIKNVMTGNELLPEWDDWGGDLGRGFMAIIGYLIYYAPLILLGCCSSAIADDNAAFGCGSIVNLLYGVAIAPFLFSAMARFAMTEKFDVFLDISGRFADFNNHTDEATSLWVNVFALNVIMFFAVPIGLVLCCIPGLVAIAANVAITAHLVGQWGRIIGADGSDGGDASPSIDAAIA